MKQNLTWRFENKALCIDRDRIPFITDLVPGFINAGKYVPGRDVQVVRQSEEEIVLSCRMGDLTGTLEVRTEAELGLSCALALTNETDAAIVLNRYAPLMTVADSEIGLHGHPAEWRVYVESAGCGTPAATFGLTEQEGSHHSFCLGMLVSPGKEALLLGQIEIARSYTMVHVQYGGGFRSTPGKYYWAHEDKAQFRLEQDAVGYQLDPGETFRLDRCVICVGENPFRLLEGYAERLKEVAGVREFTNADVMQGWMSWYNQEAHLRGGWGCCKYDCCSEEVALSESRFMKESGLQDYGMRDVSIDDGYQREVHLGDWLETNHMFPHGMDGLADELHKLGMRAGIWLAPFCATADSRVFTEHPEWFVKNANGEFVTTWDWYHANPPVHSYQLDVTHPGAAEWLTNVYLTLQKQGYYFFKNDFLGDLMWGEGKCYYDKKQTGLMRWRGIIRKVTEALHANGAAHYQLCAGCNLASIGLVDSVRVGSDVCGGVTENHWKQLRNDASMAVGNRWWQSRRFFISDQDNILLQEYRDMRSYSSVQDYEHRLALSKRENPIRMVLAFASAGNLWWGDRLTLCDQENVEMVKKVFPPFQEPAITLDMFDRTIPRLLHSKVNAACGGYDILSVINWEESAVVEKITLDMMGLDEEKEYFVWEMWEEKAIGWLDKRGLVLSIAPHTVKTLRITPVEREKPVLVGSTFHLSMGAIEVCAYEEKNSSLTLTVERPGEEEGRLVFWSPREKGIIEKVVHAGPTGTMVEAE